MFLDGIFRLKALISKALSVSYAASQALMPKRCNVLLESVTEIAPPLEMRGNERSRIMPWVACLGVDGLSISRSCDMSSHCDLCSGSRFVDRGYYDLQCENVASCVF